MLLGFKRMFSAYVEEGSKTHTIRTRRAIPPRVGEMCHCYVDPRQKTMRLLGRFPCVRVQSIRIERCNQFRPLRIWIDDGELDCDEVEAFLWRDGFRKAFLWRDGFREPVPGLSQVSTEYPATDRAAHFWRHRLPFEGQIIHWRHPEAQ